MSRSALIVILLLTVSAGSAPLFNFDYATFRVSDVNLLQVYTMIHRNSITFKPKNGEHTAEYSILVEIMKADSLLASSGYDRTDKVKSLEDISPTQKIPEETSFHIREGKYTIVVTVTDKISGETSVKKQEVTIHPYSWDNLVISDIEFASKVERSNKKGPFTKNQLQIIPHADRIYGGDILTAYYYAEIYNLSTENIQAQYTIKRIIFDQNDLEIKVLPEKNLPQNASSVVEADFFSCATLPTGSYYLKIEVTDGTSGQNAERIKRFWVYKPGEEVTQQTFTLITQMESAINSMSKEGLEKEIYYIHYLTTREEDRIIKKLKPEAYNLFLLEFWKRKDSSGLMRQRYLMRIDIADQRFGSKIQEGWKSDRGRVLILYGEPDYIERRLFEISTPDMETWYFDQIEGGVLFLFTDLKGTGDLQQVYSSMRGEFIDAGWVQEMEMRYPHFLQEIRNH